ncbi:MAG: hypothetical protein MN733_12165 [Nitrososphaera sp.]|nr:hypothetical protein [Nitrososphaera sp.]
MKSYNGTGTGKYIVKKLFNGEKYALICSPDIDEYYAEAILRLAEKGINVKVIASNSQAGRLYLEEYAYNLCR